MGEHAVEILVEWSGSKFDGRQIVDACLDLMEEKLLAQSTVIDPMIETTFVIATD